MSATTYAGFWLRFVAYVIDYIIINILQSFVLVPIFAALGIGFASSPGFFDQNMSSEETFGLVAFFMGFVGVALFLTVAIQIVYYSVMEASKSQATLGKMALGLKVTDVNGKRLDLGRSFVRQLGKIVSGFILFIGYIMAGFTEKKQALHDMMVSAVVVKK